MKKRLDLALVEQGYATGRDKAKAIIMSGMVYVNGQKFDKCGDEIGENDTVEVRGSTLKYVSRGGLKLEKAIGCFSLLLADKICCDFGASTGGFTDCMLQNGATRVYAFDVGYGQLAWKLRQDSRVINRERTNVRYLNAQDIEPVDFVSVDVSFISLSLMLPVVFAVLKDGGEAVCLIKPQFEAGRENVGKKGVVRDLGVHEEVINSVLEMAEKNNLSVKALSFSPIKGPEGNIEYLIYLKKENEFSLAEINVKEIVEKSHEELI
ncbi:MAG: TlyA family RNA methyltransferase [Oscillospiraceae bacterium]